METLTFFKRVLPTEGFYAAIIINKGEAPQQAFFSTVEELAAYCQLSDKNNNNTFYAVSSFNSRGNRKQDNVHSTKSFFLDIDCAEDKPYKNQRDGLAALLEFLVATRLPKPMIVSSGRGLHIYWVLDEALSPIEWKPIAEALKASCAKHGLDADPAVTSDGARVLRPTGTHNPKNDKEVYVLSESLVVTRREFENKLLSVKLRESNHVHVNTGLSASMITESDYPPATPELILDGCQQLRWCFDHQRDVSEPLWYNVVGIAAHCANPEQTARLWSMQHPDYSEAATLNKMQHWLASTTGPTTCTKIEADRPKGCTKCIHKGNITSPAQLGVVYAEVAISSDAPDEVAKDVEVPWPYKRVEKKGERVMIQTVDGVAVDVCPFEIYPLGYGRDESLGFETVRFKWRRKHVGWSDLVFRQAFLNDESREFATTIADQGIVLRGKKQTQGFQWMLRAYMDELRKTKTMTNIYGAMGWKEDFTQFVIGDKLYKREADGVVIVDDISLTSNTSKLSNRLYSHKGTAEVWTDATELLQKANLPAHMFALGHAFSAPLWALTGLKGITVSLCGNTGAGKSLIQLWMQSVWGNPDKLHIAAKFTQNALFHRLGTYCHLPLTIDEAGMMDDKYIGEFCYMVTQGEDKKRLTRSIEERDSKEWATCVVVSTNTSFISKLAATGLETDAQMARLLEVDMPMHKMFNNSSSAGRVVHKFLGENYGVIGHELVKAYLRKGESRLRELITESMDTFGKNYSCEFSGSERFWEADLVLLDVSSNIARKEGLIKYEYERGVQWGVDQLDALRNSVKDNTTDGFKLIHEYINEVAHEVLVVMHTDGMSSTMDQTRIPRSQIKIRFDKYRPNTTAAFDRGTVMLVLKAFKRWVSSKGYDYNTLKREVQAVNADATPSSGRCWLSRNTSLDAGQQSVFGINLNNDMMRGYLDDIPLTPQDITLNQITEVPSTEG
tara:strand:- start:8482 stop:11346 length:2865 start_codon:yes stop_codon:yes gene_type:complete